METDAPSHSGLLGSLRGFADGILGSVHDRLELLTVELHEEKHRLIQILIWVSALVSLGFLVMMFAGVALLVLFWETARVPVALSLVGIYAAALVVVILTFRKFLARQPKPFSGSLAELKNDRACIREQS